MINGDVSCQDLQKQRHGMTMSNGFILPEGKMTPNTLFVGGIDMKVGQCVRCFFLLKRNTGLMPFLLGAG